MRPETVGAFRLALEHERLADAWCGCKQWRRRPVKRKHAAKAQKLYERARKLEERGIK